MSGTDLNASENILPVDEAWSGATDHAWRYFELHAAQRMTIFNYFTFFTGLMSAGIAATLQSSAELAYFGMILGPLMVIMAFVFWKLDQRVSILIKNAEIVLANVEQSKLPKDAWIFTNELASTAGAKSAKSLLFRPWTFGTAFRIVFLAAGMIGISSGILAGLKASGVILPEEQTSIQKTQPND